MSIKSSIFLGKGNFHTALHVYSTALGPKDVEIETDAGPLGPFDRREFALMCEQYLHWYERLPREQK